MAERVRPRQICHSRAGDKGDIANVGLVVYDHAHYEWVKRPVSAEAVAKHFEPVAPRPVERHEFPKVGALNFVIQNALGGGVSRSLKIDAHGKRETGTASITPANVRREVAPTPYCRRPIRKLRLQEISRRTTRPAEGSYVVQQLAGYKGP